MSPRYAVYFVPSLDSALWHFGTGIIGYDSTTGRAVPRTQDVAAQLSAESMQEPARYGFHATLRAPFELSEGISRPALLAAVAHCASSLRPVAAGTLRPELMGSFVALVLEAPKPDVLSLASSCVVHVEHLRAPLSDADRARRLAAGLTPRQIQLMDRWGYPYVHDQFKFHMTLTGKLPGSAQQPVLAGLRELYRCIAEPLVISEVAVLEQASRSSGFRVVERFLLGKQPV